MSEILILEESKKFRTVNKCRYPNCSKDSEFTPRKELHLCEEHYKLWNFIDLLLFEATVGINLRESRLKEVEK